MSWVFLTDKLAWKLKKPVCTEYVDFRTPEARRRNCLREVRLNRRLARSVYLDVVALTTDERGELHLWGHGDKVDWLVQMRRLPEERMLDSLILRHEVSEPDLSKLASLLASFYKEASPAPMPASEYSERLAADLEAAQHDLTGKEYGLTADLAESVIHSQLQFLERNRDLFEARAREGKIVEGHGDLRPEHICLEAQPVVIDCLEFNRQLRILDAASELAFLALECERIGAPEIGKHLISAYSEQADDWPSRGLLEFYRTYHAAVRAKIAIWHLKDDAILDKATWVSKAEQYLRMATGITKAA
jgi:aminoglycoside phosphotransferase family enzyme